MNMNAVGAAGIGVLLVMLFLLIRWKLWTCKRRRKQNKFLSVQSPVDCPPCTPTQLVHRLCPHSNVVQGFEIEQKDSLDDHLDVLARKLAEKEGRLRISKSKIRETQNEIENLHAIDQDVRSKYREIMESLRNDLTSNENDCKKLQDQIEWVSRRRAELKDEVNRGHRLYGEAAAELANNLAEMHRGIYPEHRVIDKPQRQYSQTSLRHRKEPQLPRATPPGSIVIKPSCASPPASDILSHIILPP